MWEIAKKGGEMGRKVVGMPGSIWWRQWAVSRHSVLPGGYSGLALGTCFPGANTLEPGRHSFSSVSKCSLQAASIRITPGATEEPQVLGHHPRLSENLCAETIESLVSPHSPGDFMQQPENALKTLHYQPTCNLGQITGLLCAHFLI